MNYYRKNVLKNCLILILNLITKEGCPVAQPKLSNLPEAKTRIALPSGKTYLSN